MSNIAASSPLVYIGKRAPIYRERFGVLVEENRRTISGELRTALDLYLAMHDKPATDAKA